MANNPSAIKRNRQTIVRRQRNQITLLRLTSLKLDDGAPRRA